MKSQLQAKTRCSTVTSASAARRYLGVVSAALLATGMLTYAPATQAAEAENIQVVRQYITAWNSGSAEALNKVLAPQVVYFNTSNEVERTGPQAIAEVSQFLLKLLPDRKMTLRSAPVASGDSVAVQWEFTASKRAKDAEASTRQTIRFQGASIYRVANGKLIYASDYYNSQSMLRQIEP